MAVVATGLSSRMFDLSCDSESLSGPEMSGQGNGTRLMPMVPVHTLVQSLRRAVFHVH